MHEYYRHLSQFLNKDICSRTTVLSGPHIGEEAISIGDKQVLASPHFEPEGAQTLTEHLIPKPHLVLFGGGHVSLALYQLGVLQEMPMDAYDDREEFANQARFPKACWAVWPGRSFRAVPRLRPCGRPYLPVPFE
jgi:xanthine/CO dehydrogenase XdhC/CoxF family maturation factor